MIQITISAIPSQEFRCVLNDQYCVINLYQRGLRLYLDLSMGDLDICKGAICQYGADVLQSSNPYFNGTLHFYDFNGTSAPHWTGLDSRWVLLYVPENESLPEYFRF